MNVSLYTTLCTSGAELRTKRKQLAGEMYKSASFGSALFTIRNFSAERSQTTIFTVGAGTQFLGLMKKE